MPTATFHLKGLDELNRKLQRLVQRAPSEAGKTLFRTATGIIADAKERVPVDLNTLRSSGHVQLPVVSGGRVSVTCGFGGAAAKYALYVHEGIGPAVGRPAFMPPVEAILPWVKRHGIPEDRAFVVARAIGRRGLPPIKYLESALLEASSRVTQDLAADFSAIFKDVA